MSLCPCQSDKKLENCCGPFIHDQAKPPTAEELMRSRYTAYVHQDIDYIAGTQDPEHGEDFDRDAALTWAKESDWKGLSIVNCSQGTASDDLGSVEFKAHYVHEGQDCVHHEIAQFKKTDDQWLYTEGTIVGVQPIKRQTRKVGRNDPCHCGSGKKFKKCCMP